jgi:CubicO group peptidase (beta-lactamase class C family)
MNFHGRFMAALVVAFVSTSAFAQDLKPESDPGKLGFVADRLNRVTQAFQGFVDSGQIPGAVVLIARNDKVAYFQAFGFRDREQNIAMTSDTIFRIASMTKPIISVGAMMLAEEGKLDIGAPVSRYLPEFKELQVRVEQVDPATGKKETVMQPQIRQMTVQDLLRHTAGLVYPPPTGNGPVADAYRDANGDEDINPTSCPPTGRGVGLQRLSRCPRPGHRSRLCARGRSRPARTAAGRSGDWVLPCDPKRGKIHCPDRLVHFIGPAQPARLSSSIRSNSSSSS